MLPESEGAPEIRKSGHHMTDLVIGLSALFISLCSLGLSIHGAHTMERLVQANSRPFVEFSSGNGHLGEDGRFVGEMKLAIDNPGAGAALIERVSMSIDGKPAADFADALKQFRTGLIAAHQIADGEAPVGTVEYSDAATGLLLKAGREQVLLRWPRTSANAALWDLADAARQSGRFAMQACYCSIFDECWVTTAGRLRPAPVSHC